MTGFVYRRGNVLWLRWRDAHGHLVSRSTAHGGKPPLRPGQETEASALLATIERRIQAEREIMQRAGTVPVSGPLTVETYAEKWLSQRTNATAKDDATRLRLHVLPRLGGITIGDVRPRHVRDLVRALRAGPLAGKTVRNVFGTLHRMFADAVVDEVISATPCVLARGELPPVEADSSWREGAVYAPEEARALISDRRIHPLHRMLYAALFYTGARVGELAARRWRDLTLAEPLTRLEMATAYKTKTRSEGATKTGVKRATPVHPELAGLLEHWRRIGWRATFGRDPRPEDRITPSATGGFLRDNVALRWLHADCALLGFRADRRTHDTRRTFISMAEAGGAQTAHIQWVTHGPRRGSVMGRYTTLPWSTLCAVVMAVRLPPLVSPAGRLSRMEAQHEQAGHEQTADRTDVPAAVQHAVPPPPPMGDVRQSQMQAVRSSWRDGPTERLRFWRAPGAMSGLSPPSDSESASGGIAWHRPGANHAESVATCYQPTPKDAGSIPAASTPTDAPRVAELGSIPATPETLSPALSPQAAPASDFSAPLVRRTRPRQSRAVEPAHAVRVVRCVGEWLAGGAA